MACNIYLTSFPCCDWFPCGGASYQGGRGEGEEEEKGRRRRRGGRGEEEEKGVRGRGQKGRGEWGLKRLYTMLYL